MSTFGKIILLSGPSSAGKSTLSKALQSVLAEPYWHLSLDMIWFMLPPQRPDPNWYPGMTADHMKAFAHTVGSLTGLGINVIAETGFFSPEEVAVFVADVRGERGEGTSVRAGTTNCEGASARLANRDILFVGVCCPLEEIERREVTRDDREVGYSRGHYDKIHGHSEYDIQVDTSVLTPEQAAAKVKETLESPSGPFVLSRIDGRA